jgi:hypothetical protein
VKQLINVLIAVLLAAALSSFSILPAAEAGPVAGDSILEFSTVNEKQEDQEGATESSEMEPKYSFKQIAALFASLFSTPPEEGAVAQETEVETEAVNVSNDSANTVDTQGRAPEKTRQDGAEASTETTSGNDVTVGDLDSVGEVSKSVSQGVTEGSPEDLTVPEISLPSLEQAEIEQKYVTKLQSVISDYEREGLTICDSAEHDLGLILLGLDSVAGKYRLAAQALEDNCDGCFYLTLANFKKELQSGGYPDEAVRSMQECYESIKQQHAARLDEAIGK